MRDIAGRNQEPRQELERIASKENLSLRVLEMDVTNESSVENAVAAAVEQYGRLDVVINNAGIAGFGITEAYTPEQFHQIFEVNLYGVVRVNRAVLPYMRQQKSGLLIHVSSAAGRITVPSAAPYGSSKFALEALADAYRFELKPFGIDSVLVEPGIYRTEIFDKLMTPSDQQRVADYGSNGEFASRVLSVFHGAINSPDAPGSEEVAEALVTLIEMDPAARPFRTVVSAPLQQLLDPYNKTADELRTVAAQMFNVPELADTKKAAAAE